MAVDWIEFRYPIVNVLNVNKALFLRKYSQKMVDDKILYGIIMKKYILNEFIDGISGKLFGEFPEFNNVEMYISAFYSNLYPTFCNNEPSLPYKMVRIADGNEIGSIYGYYAR